MDLPILVAASTAIITLLVVLVASWLGERRRSDR